MIKCTPMQLKVNVRHPSKSTIARHNVTLSSCGRNTDSAKQVLHPPDCSAISLNTFCRTVFPMPVIAYIHHISLGRLPLVAFATAALVRTAPALPASRAASRHARHPVFCFSIRLLAHGIRRRCRQTRQGTEFSLYGKGVNTMLVQTRSDSPHCVVIRG